MSKDIGGLRGGGRGEPEGMPCADSMVDSLIIIKSLDSPEQIMKTPDFLDWKAMD